MREKVTIKYSKINKDASVGSNRRNVIVLSSKKVKSTKKATRNCSGCSRR